MSEVFDLKVYRSIDHRAVCEEFLQGHEEVLSLFGIKKLSSANASWFNNPGSYMIIARNDLGDMVGGIRLHIAEDGAEPLPLIEAIQEMDSKVHSFVAKYAVNGTGEICGLWNSRKVKGLGISFALMKGIIVISAQLGLSTILGLCSPYTLEWLKSVGFTKDESLGKNGTFYYPKEDLVATTIIVKDTSDLLDADHLVRKEIFYIRNQLRQTITTEIDTEKKIVINYSLSIVEQKDLIEFST